MAGPAQVQATGLQQQLDTLLADARFQGSQVGLVVRDATTGETLYDRDGSTRLLPASNTKLFSSTAAMHTLGPSYRFHTDVLATAPVRGGKLRGDLYLKGYGDPTALEGDYVALAKQVAKSGVRRIDGDLVADDTYFDHVRLGDSWAWDDEPFYYNAQISALTLAPNTDYDSGTAIVESLPGRRGRRAGGAEAGPGERRDQAGQHRDDRRRGVGQHARHRAGPRHQRRTGEWIGSARRFGRPGVGDRLGARGCTPPTSSSARSPLRASRVDGRIKVAATPGASARRLARDESMTVGELMNPFLKLSNNMHAETLVKAMGAVAKAPGHLGGRARRRHRLRAERRRRHQRRSGSSDGSGLSRKVNVTADSVTDLLIAAQKEPWFQQWYDALPIAGNAGPLRRRHAALADGRNPGRQQPPRQDRLAHGRHGAVRLRHHRGRPQAGLLDDQQQLPDHAAAGRRRGRHHARLLVRHQTPPPRHHTVDHPLGSTTADPWSRSGS